MTKPLILLVDDDANSRTGLERLLTLESFTVSTACDGVEALEQLERAWPDVIVTDLHMPRLDGLGLCANVHARDEHLPVILVSALGELGGPVGGMRVGAIDYFTKPVDIEALVATIRRAIAIRVLRLERQAALAQAQAMALEALEAVRLRDEILSIVAHDLRAPLSVAMLQAQRLVSSEDEETRSGSERIVRSCRRMDSLVRDLMTDARRRIGELPLDLAVHEATSLLEEASELRPLALQRSCSLLLVGRGPQRSMRFDRARVTQVLTNLASNAISFARTKITVTVDTTHEELWVSVHDDGLGIEPEASTHVFERHWQDRKRTSGLGLGLYIAKQIVDAHGGRIWVESVVDVGTTFFFTIPDAKPVPDAVVTRPSAPSPVRVPEAQSPDSSARV